MFLLFLARHLACDQSGFQCQIALETFQITTILNLVLKERSLNTSRGKKGCSKPKQKRVLRSSVFFLRKF